MKEILVPISPGELIDKLTILRLKSERIADAAKLRHVAAERAMMEAAAGALPRDAGLATLEEELYRINAALWQVEDDLRACEATGDFGERFVALARAVYRTNDRRAEVKRQINLGLGSALVEEKSYTGYGAAR